MTGSGATSRSSGSPENRPEMKHVHIEVADLGTFKMKGQTHTPATTDVDGPPCGAAHLGYVVSGHVHVALEGDEELDVRTGDLFVIPPGHDDRTTGEEPCLRVRLDPGEPPPRPSTTESRATDAA